MSLPGRVQGWRVDDPEDCRLLVVDDDVAVPLVHHVLQVEDGDAGAGLVAIARWGHAELPAPGTVVQVDFANLSHGTV